VLTRSEIKEKITTYSSQPLLVGFLANEDPAAKMYADWTAKTCAQTGIAFELRQVKRTTLENAIIEANEGFCD
jgi:methylenetetrahydrofolate dehydrogenase (NAD+)